MLLAETQEDLQKLSDIVYSWSKKWRMVVNLDKTKIVVFRGKQITMPDCKVSYGSEMVEVVREYRYLGVYLDEHMTFEGHVTKIASAGGRALGGILNKCSTLKDLGYKTYDRLFHMGVASVLDYGSEVMNLTTKQSSEIDKVQYRACRYFLGVGRYAALCSLNAEMGWRRYNARAEKNRCRYYNRILKMDKTRIPRQIFLECKSATGTISNGLLHSLRKLGEERNWLRDTPLDLSVIDNNIERRETELWKEEISEKRKLYYFEKIKLDTNASLFVKANLPRFERSLLSRLRNGSLMLRLEYGRFNREPRSERIC